MSSNTLIFKKVLLFITLLILFLPILQNRFNFLSLYKLAGDTIKRDTSFTNDNFFSGTWQHKMEQHLTSEFGFRSLLIKINNQLHFSLFNTVNAKGVIAGKEEYLFETTYIHSFLGHDFMGKDSLDNNVKRLNIISDKLKKLNKNLVIVIAPSKPSFYKEFLPADMGYQTMPSNYSYIAYALERSNIDCIDFSKWFNELKNKSKYPLYPKHGNHWSNYGAYLAADSLIRYIEFKKNIDMPGLIVKNTLIEQPKNEDKDIEYGINLLFKLNSFDLAYPEVITENAKGKVKPTLLVIGDSFYWNLYNSGFKDCFSKPSFWYYNKAEYPIDSLKPKQLDEMYIKHELNNKEVIVILATESNIKSLGWGFLDDAEKYLHAMSIN